MNENVKNIISYINENLYNNIKISDIENEFHYNKHYIMRLFKKETGLTITDYMNQVKILNSLSQLSKTNDLILKVALDNGFNSQEYYCEIFYKVMNQTPSNYRKISQNTKSTKIILKTLIPRMTSDESLRSFYIFIYAKFYCK